ncbi:uncharacterized protein E5676_scaffold600G001370 [Cucumis melo var. makuwa]|uniref:Reverse transcriptase domain-containing protein n=1 Tax=Cucumis melo var. makuwa TaxID=1194695 RepID=A0A5D3DXQ8_CUCMM|nr:uncharacterized protein E5676_scaffold600G001370 [Cucumis melo var. makuwa]
MLLRKWTPSIVPESFVFTSVPVWIKLGRIPMELWTEAGLTVVASDVGKPLTLDLATKERCRLSYARVCIELDVNSHMPAEITVSLKGVDFIVSVNYEWKPRKCNLCCAFEHSSGKCPRSVENSVLQEVVVSKIILGKRDELDSETCGEVVLESFKQLEEGEIRSSPNRPSSQVEKEGLPPPLQMDKDVLLSGFFIFWGHPLWGSVASWRLEFATSSFETVSRRFGNSWDYSCSYSNSGVGQIWVMWKKNSFSFSTRVVDEQFVTGTLTDLLSGVRVEVFYVYASNSNIERRLLWCRLVEITYGWSSPGMVMGDFNAIRVHSEAFGGSPIQGEMEDFDLAIRDADLVEPSVQGNWFTWTSKNRRVVSFRFFNHWMEDPSFIEVVSRMWGRNEGVSPLVSLIRNLQHLKSTIRRHFGRHIQSLSEEVRNAKEAMDRAQREVKRNPMSDVLSRQAGLATEAFWTTVRLEEASLHQKFRIRWLELGNQNTAFFHRSVSSRSQEICYRELSPVIDDIVQFRWSEECCQALQVPISREEVRRVLFSMDSRKASGHDGFSVSFFKGDWSVVREDFCDVILHFFETCYLPLGVNATTITLIPKRRGAECIEEFRPISYCNVIYKCISKILADRLCVWLPSFISGNQSAFIPGRSIIDNILLCQELDFLFELLIAIGTPLKKGVRQGYPLSPFLFVMVMEALSRMLNMPPQSFQFYQRCGKVKLTHLTFADDLMIFCVADDPSLSFIRESLQKFGELLGLFANLRKSSIFVAGGSNEAASHLAASMGFVLGNLPVRYLGLPLLTVYWASVFVLPASVHNEVDKILRSYLWRGKEEGRRGVKAYILKGRLLWVVDNEVGRSWCLRAILRKRDRLKHHVQMNVGDGSRCRVWLDPWLQGGPILKQVREMVLYDAASWREARLSEFIDPDGEWQWPQVSMELIDLWDRVQAVSPCLSVRDIWSGFLVVRVVSLSRVHGKIFVLGAVRFFGLVFCGVGGISQSIPFVCGWPLKIGWPLEIDYIGGIVQYRCRVFYVRGVLSLAIPCSFRVLLGGMFDLGSFESWLPIIGLGIEGLSCLGFVIRVLERV